MKFFWEDEENPRKIEISTIIFPVNFTNVNTNIIIQY